MVGIRWVGVGLLAWATACFTDAVADDDGGVGSGTTSSSSGGLTTLEPSTSGATATGVGSTSGSATTSATSDSVTSTGGSSGTTSDACPEPGDPPGGDLFCVDVDLMTEAAPLFREISVDCAQDLVSVCAQGEWKAVVFRWAIPNSDTYIFNTFGSDVETRLTVLVDDCSGASVTTCQGFEPPMAPEVVLNMAGARTMAGLTATALIFVVEVPADAQGTVRFNIRPEGANGGNCCVVNGGAGCEIDSVANCVCGEGNMDLGLVACCETAWTQDCADLAQIGCYAACGS